MAEINVKNIDDDDFKKFRKKIDKQGTTAAFVIKKFIKEYGS